MDESDVMMGSSEPKAKQQAYKKIKVLGEGAMGKAYLVESASDHQLYVMKRINIGHLSPQQKQLAMRQAQLHSLVHHANIIAFKQIYHTTGDKLCIIMEYAENGDLDQFLQAQEGKLLSEDTVLDYFAQICLGLMEIHLKKIIHRDIKAANIFITKDMKVKIGDFGISKVIDQTVQASKSFVGTPYYLSPEMVEGKPYSTKADIWALGVLLYLMCSQKLPFQANSLPLLALRILKGAFPPINGPFSKDMKSLILSMLQVDAKKRPTIIEILKKPFIFKRVPKQSQQQILCIQQRPKLPKNQTVANLASPSLGTAKPSKKSTLGTNNKIKISEQQKKMKEKQLKQEKKKKRDEEFKQMKDDIRKKRMEAQKDKIGSGKTINQFTGQNQTQTMKVPSKRKIQQQKSPKKQLIQQQTKKTIEKPWRSIQNKGGSKKQVAVQILVPSLKPKSKQPQNPPPIDFQIQIKQYGKKPISSPSNNNTQKTNNNLLSVEDIPRQEQSSQRSSISDECQSIEEEVQPSEQERTDYQKMMNHFNHAQQAVKGLKINPNHNIELYEQSGNFDDDDAPYKKPTSSRPASQLPTSSLTPPLPQMNTMQQQSWKAITHYNSQILQQCRQVLEQGLGQQKFIKAYHIVNQHLQQSQIKKMRGEQLQTYTFNREILREKLDFLTDREFVDYVTLLYTVIVIEIQQMKNNLDD